MSTNDIKTTIITSNCFDPWYNLSLEEYLVNNVEPNEVILYLWQNQNTVVIGSHQNSWKECKCKELENDGGKLARRLSGGGAVFHDLGNLNFTFVTGKALYNLEKQLSVILQAARAHGIEANFSGRNDIEVEGKKFSGNAFYYTKKACYHHGTILIDVDMSKLSRYLQVSKEKIQSKGVDSVKARVINLKSLNENITIDSMKDALKKSFKEIYGGEGEEFVLECSSFNLDSLYEKYSSWQWLYGESPAFDITLSERFSWGGVDLCIVLKKGVIEDVKIYSDAMDNSLFEIIIEHIKGLSFNLEAIVEAIENIDCNENLIFMKKDLIQWLKEKSKEI